jgi:RNA polymerase primary sigma factor
MSAPAHRSIMSHYSAEIGRHPRLTAADERRISRRIHGGERSAVDELVTPNLAYVATIARQYLHRGVPFEDLLHEGALGLIEAARRFDPDRNIRFVVYAAWWIRKYLAEATYRQGRQVLPPKRKVVGEDGVPRRVPISEFSLDVGVNPDGDSTLQDRLVDATTPDAESSAIRAEIGITVTQALECLNPVERHVMRRRFGLDGEPKATLREIGEQLGVTRERIRQIETRARETLRRHLMRERPSGCRWNAPTA